MQDASSWVWLQEEVKLKPEKALALLRTFGSAEAIAKAEPVRLKTAAALSFRELAALRKKAGRRTEEILRQCKANNIRILTLYDPDYPQRLRNIFDPPLVLYIRGRLPDLNKLPSITVVGPREASPYGVDVARQIGWQLSTAGTVVVSGMAKGIDSAAHRGALLGGTPTVAVFGTAIDVCYPRENVQLMRDILQNGCLISEYPPGAVTGRSHFPRRNRIMSGLSLGTVVAEAPAKSGSLITAEFAAEQGRDVFAVPGSIRAKDSEGANKLIQSGAKLVTCGADILEEYRHLYPQTLDLETLREKRPAKTPDSFVPIAAVLERKPPKQATEAPQPARKPVAGDETQAAVLKALAGGKRQADELAALTGLPASKVLTALTMLELTGAIRQLPGQYYELN